jgi:hypothetical protein
MEFKRAEENQVTRPFKTRRNRELVVLTIAVLAIVPNAFGSGKANTCLASDGTRLRADSQTQQVIPSGTPYLLITFDEPDYPLPAPGPPPPVCHNVCDPNNPYSCHEECSPGSPPNVPGPVTAKVVDSNGVTIFQETLTPHQSADPTTTGAAQQVQREVDVHTFTANGDWLIYLSIDIPSGRDFVVAEPPSVCHLPINISCARLVFDLDQGLATFDPNQAKMLTHKYRSDDAYFSIYQRTTLVSDPNPPPLPPGTPPPPPRPQMDITGSVVNAPADGPYDVYFKLVDPKDPSPYAVGDAHAGDNGDTQHPALLMLPDGTHRTNVGTVLHTTWDRLTRKVALVLEGTDHYAGDNYQVEASFDQAFPCENTHDPSYPCATTAIMTTWKRIYIETDHMFRSGAFVTADTDPAVADVEISEQSSFVAGQSVRFIHGSPFHHGLAPAGSPFGDTSFFEDATILTPAQNDPLGAIYIDTDGHWHMRLTHPLRNVFLRTDTRGVSFWADAVGPMTAPGNGFFEPNTSLLHDYFATMFVDVADAPQTVSEFPHLDIDLLPQPAQRGLAPRLMANRWFQNSERGTASPDDAKALPNHIHLVGATAIPLNPACGTDLGDTYVSLTSNVSWIWVRRIEDAPFPFGSNEPAQCVGLYQGTHNRVPAMVNGLSVTHELTHQWDVNPPVATTFGHCGETSATVPGDVCLMNRAFFATAPPVEIDSGRATLHYLAHGANSEYSTVRSQLEPIPQQQ